MKTRLISPLVATFLALFLIAEAQSGPVLVSAAASLTDALREIGLVYQQVEPGHEITYNFGGSGALQRQIENGAPVDVFIAAAAAPMDALEKQGLLVPQTRKDLLTNTLVLVTSKRRHDLTSFADLSGDRVRHIAIGEPRVVPAGIYAIECLRVLKLVPQIESKLVRMMNVRQVLAAVETANADAGLVYQTDATTSKSVRMIATAPEGSHQRILYPVAIARHSKQPEDARTFVAFLQSESARAIFEKHGFVCVK